MEMTYVTIMRNNWSPFNHKEYENNRWAHYGLPKGRKRFVAGLKRIARSMI